MPVKPVGTVGPVMPFGPVRLVGPVGQVGPFGPFGLVGLVRSVGPQHVPLLSFSFEF